MDSMLRVEDGHRDCKAEFFQHGRDHHRPKADRISGDDKESDLPRQAGADESVVETRMGDGWRVLTSDHVEHEVKRSQYDNAPGEGDVEKNLGEFHGVVTCADKPTSQELRFICFLAGYSLVRIVEEKLIPVGIIDHQEPVAPRTF